MTAREQAEWDLLRDSHEAREKAVAELRARRDRLSKATLAVPHDEFALADQAARNAGSAETAFRLGLYAGASLEEAVKVGQGPKGKDVAGEVTAHTHTLARCLLESRRLEP